jgi:hypothetical protein
MSQPMRRAFVETYLRNRGIKAVYDAGTMLFHPNSRREHRPNARTPVVCRSFRTRKASAARRFGPIRIAGSGAS